MGATPAPDRPTSNVVKKCPKSVQNRLDQRPEIWHYRWCDPGSNFIKEPSRTLMVSRAPVSVRKDPPDGLVFELSGGQLPDVCCSRDGKSSNIPGRGVIGRFRYRPGEMPVQICGQTVSAPRGKAGVRLNAHEELRAKASALGAGSDVSKPAY